jgi:hypothetical protein
MTDRFPYSKESIDFSLKAYYPELDSSNSMLLQRVMRRMAEDFFCGTISLEKTDHLSLRSALADYNEFGSLRPSDHKTFIAATDQDDDVIDNLTKEERFVAVALAVAASKLLVVGEDVRTSIQNVFQFATSGHDDCFRVIGDVTFIHPHHTDHGHLNVLFDSDLNVVRATLIEGSDEMTVAQLEGSASTAVAAKRDELIERFGLTFGVASPVI